MRIMKNYAQISLFLHQNKQLLIQFFYELWKNLH